MTHDSPRLERWSRAIVRFRLIVLACWLAIALAGTAATTQLPALLTTSLAVPGTSSARADALLATHFGENPEGTYTVVLRSRQTRPATVQRFKHRLVAAARVVPGSHVMPLKAVAGVIYGSIVTRLNLQQAQRLIPALRHELAASGPPAALVTGPPALQYDVSGVLADDLRRGETIAVPIALLVLILVLGPRPILLVPLLFAFCTITASLGVVYALARAILMVSYVPNFVELVGLGLAIDYSLLFAYRFREEVCDEGSTVSDAVVRTMGTAGRSVVFSGVAVAVALSAVLIIPVPFIRSMGVAGVIVPLVSIAAALTLQPALLSLVGRRGVRPMAGQGEESSGAWAQIARTIIRHRLAILVFSTALLAGLATPIARLRVTPGSLSSIPRSTESASGVALLRDRVGPGLITPIQIVLDAGAPRRARSTSLSAATLRLASDILHDPEVFIAAIGPTAPYVDRTGRYRRVIVYPRHDFGDASTRHLVTRLREQIVPGAHIPARVQISVGGVPAQGVDFLTQVYDAFPWIVALVLALAYVVLLRAFRSLILPLVAVVLDLLSVAAAYGLLVMIFERGLGNLVFGLYHTPAIEGWVPIFLFATLFGLSMDYQVFLVTRMREARDRGERTMDAIAHGLERTGRIVTAAAVIMVATLLGFAAGRIAGLQELGVGLALGVLLDATVVRILLLPSAMALLGRWCWWLPHGAAHLIRVEPSPLGSIEGRGLSTSADSALTSQR